MDFKSPNNGQELYARAYRQEALRQQARHELIRQAKAVRPTRAPFYRPVIAFVGRVMIALGERLQGQPGQKQLDKVSETLHSEEPVFTAR